MQMSVTSRRSSPASRHRRTVSRWDSPASTRMRAPGASTQTQLPRLPLPRPQRRTRDALRVSIFERPVAEAIPGPQASVLERRDATTEKEHQAPEQGEAERAEAPPGPPQQEPAEGEARQVASVQRPGGPKPPAPRAVAGSSEVSRNSPRTTGAKTSCAIRSPRESATSSEPRVTRIPATSPR